MKAIFTAILLLVAFNSIYAQEQIKKIIYEDLFSLDDLYNGCIIQFEQKAILIKGNDTISDFKTVETIRQDFNRVTLVKIDSVNQYYFVEVKFDLIPNSRYLGLFSNNTFIYVLYKKSNKYYKINGFLVSEILLTDTPREYIRSMARIEAPNKFTKHIRCRNIDKIEKYLSVSVLEKINQLGFQYNYRPYVKDILCY